MRRGGVTGFLLKAFLIYLGLCLVVGLVMVGLSYPKLPQTKEQWLLIFFAPVSIYLAIELIGGFFGDWLHDNRVTRYVERRTAGKSFSGLRILYNLVYLLVLIGLLGGILYACRRFG